ncbi:MAG: ECF transporter S component [Peptoniphilaceae bacterium]|nr:ECF transporter S component [Peptoniphilaceae bacterium]
MKKFNRPIAVVLAILAALAVRLAGEPAAYMGAVAALVCIAFGGFLTDAMWGGVLGAVSMGAGIVLRNVWPDVPNFSAKKMARWQPGNDAYNAFLSQNWWMLILAAVAVGVIFGLLGQMLEKRAAQETSAAGANAGIPAQQASRKWQDYFTARRVAQMGLFVALGVAINTVRVGALSFGGLPIIFSGYFLGPLGGFIVGGVTDLVAFIVRPSSAGFNPVYTLTSALTGIIPVVVTNLLGERDHYTFPKVLIGVLVGQVVTSVVLVPLFMSFFISPESGKAQFFKMLVKQAFSIPVYAFLTVTMLQSIKKTYRASIRRVPSNVES